MSFIVTAYIAFVVLAFLGLLALDFRSALAKKQGKGGNGMYSARVLVIVPCKGIDLTLSENLRSLDSQDYTNYSVVGIVDDEKDEAVPIIKEVGLKYCISDSACTKCSKKVRAISTALEKFTNFDAYVIADSDIKVDRKWLGRIVGPLSDTTIGLSTMFPYFNPVKGFWSEVKLVWGFLGERLLENRMTRFGWGGALAFRNDLLGEKDLDFFKNSTYSISDDICLTKIVKSKGLGIAYTKLSQPVVNTQESFGSFLQWSNRQAALTLLANSRSLYFGLAFYFAEILVFVSGIMLAGYVSPIFLLLLVHALWSEIKSYRRAHRKDLVIALITLCMPFIYIGNLIAASTSRSITWRGTTYRLS